MTESINRAADSHEIRPLTGVRGVAAMLVVLYHFRKSWLVLFPGAAPVSLFAARGFLGVDVFFMLSGFILCYVYPSRNGSFGLRGYGRFLWYRLARIYPNHLAMLAVFVALAAAGSCFGIHFGGSYPIEALPAHLTMTHAWSYIDAHNWNQPSWSISAEWFAYLFIFPACWFALRCRVSARAFLGGSYVALLLFALCGFQGLDFESHYSALIRVGCEFIAGSLLFGAYSAGTSVTRFCQRWVTIIVLVLLATMALLARGVELGALILFPAILLGLTSEESLVAKLLSTGGALFLGRISYAIYMSHTLAQVLLNWMLPAERYVHAPLFVRALVLCTNLGLIGSLASGLYFFVEVPARKQLRALAQWWSGRRFGAKAPAAQKPGQALDGVTD